MTLIHVTPSDISKLKTKLKATVPTSHEDFILMLKRFCNALFGIFSGDSPYFKCCVKVVDVLQAFSRPARAAMTTNTRAAILWILLLQSRQFAMGNMDILSEFATMQSDLRAKRGVITHAEVPIDLVSPSNKRVIDLSDSDAEQTLKKKKRQRDDHSPPKAPM